MNRHAWHELPALVRALESRGVPVEALVEQGPPARRRPIRRYVGRGLVLDVATHSAGARLNLLESAGRAWARSVGLPTAPVVAVDDVSGSWLLGELLPTVPSTGPDYVQQALCHARRLSGSVPPLMPLPATSWRAPRRTMPVRAVRMLAGRMSLVQFRQVRDAASRLPRSPVAHCDYTYRNVLLTTEGDVRLVDWEYLGPGPANVDPLRLWSTMKSAADRDELMQSLLKGLSSQGRKEVGLLALWLCLRLRAENIAAPTKDRNQADAEHAWRMTGEAAALARELRSWPS